MVHDPRALEIFLRQASAGAYAGSGQATKTPERPGFIELVYTNGDYSYRDSYTGHSRSRGMEVIRYKGEPVWASLYGGGMTTGNEAMADETFTFLKQALSTDEPGFSSLRGPHHFTSGDWEYRYGQTGDIAEFKGHEKSYRDGKLVFFHEIIGEIIDPN